MPRSGSGRGALAGVAVTAVLALAFGTAGATQPTPAPPPGGMFGAPWHASTGRLPIDIVSADFDGDGDPDLAALSRDRPTGRVRALVAVLHNDGRGRFGKPAYTLSGRAGSAANPSDVVAGDLDGDGRPDLVVGTRTRNISVLRSDGRGGIAPARIVSAGTPLRGKVKIADLTGDRIPDLVALNGASDVVVLAGGAGGEFDKPVGVTLDGSYADDFLLLDANGDGAVDILVPHRAGPELTVHLNTGPGSVVLPALPPVPAVDEIRAPVPGFTEPTRYALGGDSAALATADFDRDGVADMAVAQPGLLRVAVSLGDGRGGFGQTHDLHRTPAQCRIRRVPERAAAAGRRCSRSALPSPSRSTAQSRAEGGRRRS